MKSNPIFALHGLGQSLWYDNIERRLLESGEFAAMVSRGDIRGVTSNPSIFHNAIAKSSDYDAELMDLAGQGSSTNEIYEHLAIRDIQAAADIFLPLFEDTKGGDGYVSLEVNPQLANDTNATCEEAMRLWGAVDRPNLMIKIPATQEGIPAISESIRSGINVNVTLIFSQVRYVEVMEAYIHGLERRLSQGGDISKIASVASFFVSRIDSKVDGHLKAIEKQGGPAGGEAAALAGRLAVSNARLAYQRYKEVFARPRFQALKNAGGRIQRPLWASTSTKNPAYRDVKYLEELIGPDTVNTVPPKTLEAFKDHGVAALTLEKDLAAAKKDFERLSSLGIDFSELTAQLELEGVRSFADAFTALIDTIDTRRQAID